MKHVLLTLVATLGMVLIPMAADAQTLGCQNSTPSGSFYPTGDANGKTGNQDFCSDLTVTDSNGKQHTAILGTIICNFVAILNSVLDSVYCGLQYFLAFDDGNGKSILGAIITLYIAVFGVRIMMGTAELNARDIIKRLLKIAGVWVFATNASYIIGYGMSFFFNAMGAGVVWMLTAMEGPVMSRVIGIIGGMNGSTQLTNNVMPLFTYVDLKVWNALTSPLVGASWTSLVFFWLLLWVYPPLLIMALYWVKMTIELLAKAFVGFLLGLASIAFLIALSPIFLSLFLFKSTAHYFDDWLTFMISYTLQVIVVFAFLAVWINLTLYYTGFLNDLAQIIVPVDASHSGTVESMNAMQSLKSAWTLKPYTFTPNPSDPTGQIVAGAPTVPNGGLFCGSSDTTHNIVPDKISACGDLLYYLIFHLSGLLLISYAFNALMQSASQISRELAGPQYVPILSGLGMGAGSSFGQFGGSSATSPLRRWGRTLSGEASNNAAAQYRRQAGQMTSHRE